MEMRLDRRDRATGDLRDLGERTFAEEAHRDDLAIWLFERRDRGPKLGIALADDRGDFRIVAVGHVHDGRNRRSLRIAAPGCRRWDYSSQGIERIDPKDGSSASRLAQGDPDRDPGDPRSERTIAAP